MAPKLYMAEFSPAVRAVLLCEKALDIKLEHIHMNLFNKEHFTPEYTQLNPVRTIPTLVDDDGTVIWDSHVIMSYLVGKYGKDDSLYPKDLKKRALIDQRMYFEIGNLFVVIKAAFASLRTKQADSISEEYKAQTESAYEILEHFFQGNLWVAGNEITIADFSLIASISSAHIMIPVDAKYKNIHAWLKRAEALPYYDANAKGLEVLKNFCESFTKK